MERRAGRLRMPRERLRGRGWVQNVLRCGAISHARPLDDPLVTSDRRVLVIGGTRGTGLLIARQLDRGGVPVRALARDPVRAARVLGPSVEVVAGDLTKPRTLPAAMTDVSDVIFTAGCRSGYPVREATVRATEYEGVLHTLDAARSTGFSGRLLYMNSSGVGGRSLATVGLNLYKGNTLVWRERAEEAIRASGIAYTIIRAGFLLNRPGGTHPIEVAQRPLPLSLRYRIARADVAEVFVTALGNPRVARTTFEVVWARDGRRESIAGQMERLEPDALAPRNARTQAATG